MQALQQDAPLKARKWMLGTRDQNILLPKKLEIHQKHLKEPRKVLDKITMSHTYLANDNYWTPLQTNKTEEKKNTKSQPTG